jgi:acetyl-CoA/propionyl-CoA carboxylase biotin carboxyl carrier protein
MFKKVLVANRGEIAIRVIRACRDLGIRTVAVYSDFDRNSLHVRLADEAYHIGPSPASDSYLAIPRILEVGRESGADACHPGYGFLAENAEFAAAVQDSGMTWIGPSPDAIATMGDKVAARRTAESAGFRPVPGTLEKVTDPQQVIRFGSEHGWPVAIKAAAGGGGKGMRVVYSPEDVEAAFESAKREAAAYFKDDSVYLEKYIERPRHVEVQILGDLHGNVCYIGERDCSSQRKNQKVVEECPCPSITDKTRRALGEAAVSLAKACGYHSAGTIECLVDPDENFYFLEMNTRIQVEHCVTEEVYGVDLVAAQIKIAAGEKLPYKQETLVPRGHAIECRINAEDPSKGFMPSPGRILEWRMPEGPGIRVDSGYGPGSEVGQFYDNLVAKLIAWGETRAQARARMLRALEETVIEGIATNIPLHKEILRHPDFIEARIYTKFVEDELDLTALAAPAKATAAGGGDLGSDGRRVVVEVGKKRFELKVFGLEQEMAPMQGQVLTLPGAPKFAPKPRPAVPATSVRPVGTGSPGEVTAPMQGTIVQILVEEGQEVQPGDVLCILEAMKMENQIIAESAGIVAEVRCKVGDSVGSGDVLVVIR